MIQGAPARSVLPVEAGSIDQLDCTTADRAAVRTALDWALAFLASPHPDLGRKGPVCPYIRTSITERLMYVATRPEAECDDEHLVEAVRSARQWFADLQASTPEGNRHLVTILVVLPRIDRASSAALDALHRSLKDEFVQDGLMIGQFHPRCEAPGLWAADFRPLQSPVPLLAIREMVPSDLPFLVDSPVHAATYFERYARSIPPHTRRFLVDRLVHPSGMVPA